MSDPRQENPDALVDGNRVTTARDLEAETTPDAPASAGSAPGDPAPAGSAPGYEGEAPNLPLASQGSRDGTPADDDEG